MNKILLWLQRNVRISFASLILTMLTVWFAYDQYLVNHGGTITSVLYNTEIQINNRVFQICKTQDSTSLYYPQLLPRVRNNSKYTLNHLKIKHVINTPKDTSNNLFIQIDPRFVPASQKYDAAKNVFKTEYYFKEDAFYPTDETPDLFKSILFLSNIGDTIPHFFEIETTVSWDANDPIKYHTLVYYKTVPDFAPFNKKDSSYVKNDNLWNWVASCTNQLKKHPLCKSDYDLMLYYHYMSDSLSQTGTRTHLHSISTENLDSLFINNNANRSFVVNHNYNFENKEFKITVPIGRWFSFILLNGILLIALVIGFNINLPNYNTEKPNHIISTCVINIFVILLGMLNAVLYVYKLVPPQVVRLFDIIGIIIALFSAIIIMNYCITKIKKSKKKKTNWVDLMWPLCYFLLVVSYAFVAFYEHSML